MAGTNLFAGTYGSGVFLSNDSGTSWTPINSGLTGLRVPALAITETKLLAGTEAQGVWMRPLSEIPTDVKPPSAGGPRQFKLEQNYPNPFNPSTTIRYVLPANGRVRLSVFNALGQQVTTLVNEDQSPGFHDFRFDASNLASGVYFYRLQAGGVVQTKRLLLLR